MHMMLDFLPDGYGDASMSFAGRVLRVLSSIVWNCEEGLTCNLNIH